MQGSAGHGEEIAGELHTEEQWGWAGGEGERSRTVPITAGCSWASRGGERFFLWSLQNEKKKIIRTFKKRVLIKCPFLSWDF